MRSKMLISLGILSIGVFISQATLAQLRDRASLSFESLPEASGLNTTQTEINVSHRIQLDPDGEKLLTISAQYRDTQFDYAGSPNTIPALANQRVQLFVPQFTYLQVLNEEYSLVVQARPGYFAGTGVSMQDSYRFEGSFFFSKSYSDKLTLGYGIAKGSNFGRVLTVPILQVLYFYSEKIMIDALLPVRADAVYLFSKDLEAGASFNIIGSNYRLDPANHFGADTLQFANITLGGTVRYQTFTNLYLSAELGTTVMRRFNFMGNSNQEISPDNTLYARLGFQYRF